MMPTEQSSIRIAIVGPAGSGKLTSLRKLIGSVPQKLRGKLAPVESEGDVILSIQLGTVNRGDARQEQKLEFWTVHGEVASMPTWRTLLRHAEGILFLADSRPTRHQANVNHCRRIREALDSMDRDPDNLPWVFAWNKRDEADDDSIRDLSVTLNTHNSLEYETVAISGYGLLKAVKSLKDQVLEARGMGMPLADVIDEKLSERPASDLEQSDAINESKDAVREFSEDQSAASKDRVKVETEVVQHYAFNSGIELEKDLAVQGEAEKDGEKTGRSDLDGLPAVDPFEMVADEETGGLPGYASIAEPVNEESERVSSGPLSSIVNPMPESQSERSEEGLEPVMSENPPLEAEREDVDSVASDDKAGEEIQPERASGRSPKTRRKRMLGFNTFRTFALDDSSREEASEQIQEPGDGVSDRHDSDSEQKTRESVTDDENLQPAETGSDTSRPVTDKGAELDDGTDTSEEKSDEDLQQAAGPVFRFPDVKKPEQDEFDTNVPSEKESKDRGNLWRRLARNMRGKGN